MRRDAAFEDLIAEHGAMLSRIAAGYEADPERRRELRQEILLAVWRAVPGFRGEAPLKAFLARVAHNRAVTHVAREAAAPRRAPLDDNMASDAPSPHDRLEADDLRERLAQAVRALPLSLRQPALLTLEGFQPGEIAVLLDLTPNTVSIRLTRARAALRVIMDTDPPPAPPNTRTPETDR